MHSSCSNYLRRACYLAVTLLLCRSCYQSQDFDGLYYEENEAIVSQKDVGDTNRDSNFILVSTLDGEIAALDINNQGNILWKDVTGPGPLLSSTISHMPINVNNQLIRLVPSLSGGLYKFDGENVEAFPITAESLLSSSVRIADQSIITGGNELRTYGINPETGEVKYVCEMSHCIRAKSKSENINEKILVLKRRTQTVRAVDPMTGVEKWNFSVGQNEALLLSASCPTSEQKDKKSDDSWAYNSEECPANGQNHHANSKYHIKFVVPEGIVCAVDKDDPNNIIWKKKLSSPVVNAWEINDGFINKVDLFHDKSIPALQNTDAKKDDRKRPFMYMGLYNKQLYIQEAVPEMDRHKIGHSKPLPHYDQLKWSRLPFKPFSASTKLLTSIQNYREQADALMEKSDSETALAVPYHACDLQNGYYLFGDESLLVDLEPLEANPKPDKEGVDKNSTKETELYEDSIDQIVIMSLWHWWREVVAISIATSILMNVLISKMKRKLYHSEVPSPEGSSSILSNVTVNSKKTENEENISPDEPNNDSTAPPFDFVSRFETDFDVVQCLGKGGFGQVFEARNAIDDCHYAVKRICLPNRKNAREKVMREVKALAKLDHSGIVRYFNAWLECPPPEWKDKYDTMCNDPDSISPSAVTSARKNASSHIRSTDDVNRTSFNVLNSSTSPFNMSNDLKFSDKNSSFGVVFEHSNYAFQKPEESCHSASSKIGSVKNLGSDTDSTCDSSFHEMPQWLKPKDNTQTDSVIFEDSGCINRDEEDASDEESQKKLSRPKTLHVASMNKKIYLYIQMQLCKKETLKDWMSEHNQTRDKVLILDIFDQILCAVEYVHEQNLMHRDLKPSNIFFSLDGLVKIGDFGLVTAMTESQIDSSHTPLEQRNYNRKHTDQVGTQLYMSPEQIAGKPYNHKVDIFSLGLILFELLVSFGTSMERVKIMSDVKRHQFPDNFIHSKERLLLKTILSHNPEHRPEASSIKYELHFQFPTEALEGRL